MAEKKRQMWELQQMQGLPLNLKIRMTKSRIRDWVNYFGEDGVYISFSGGKDSTVLLDLVRQDYPNIPAVFVDVPTQYPELRDFAKTFDNVEIIRPKINFMQVCEKYGFPIISKEVSECVSGARKYLTKVLEENNLDRQTDRQTDSINTLTTTINSQETEHTVNFRKPLVKLLEKHTQIPLGGVQTLLPIRNRKNTWNQRHSKEIRGGVR